MINAILLIVLGFFLLVLGADWLVKGASNLAKKFNIPDIIIGLTIVALGTSMPELMITIASSIKGSSDLIIGNAIGSSLCNLLLILGVTSLIRPIFLDKEVRKMHIPIAVLTGVLILFMCNNPFAIGIHRINKKEGLILISLFCIYFIYPIYIAIGDIIKQHKSKNDANNVSVVKSVIIIILGAIFLKYGGDFVVDNAIIIAKTLNISEKVIGSTIIAIGTALPELITSIAASIKKEFNMAVGNLLGSNVLNLLLILGIGSMIHPIDFKPEFNIDLGIYIFSTILLWIMCGNKKRNCITRGKALLLVCIFASYTYRLLAI